MGFTDFVKPTKKRLIILGLLAVAIIVGISLLGSRKQALLQFTTVKKQVIRSTVVSSGNLTGKESAGLHFKTAGNLRFINVKVGDKVLIGQIIAGLDTQDLIIASQQAQNTLRDKQASVDKILDDIHLFQYGNGGFANVGSPNETMAQRQLRTSSEVARDNAFDAVRANQRFFQDSVIISPINGLVTQAIQVPGQIVTGADLIAQVVDTTSIYFDTEVDEADIGSISMGKAAEVTLDAYQDQKFSGVVDQIQPQVKTTSSGASVIVVRIKLDNPKITFINGLSGQSLILIKEATDTLTLPVEALREDNTVVVSENNQLTTKKVTTGIKSETDVEIKEGLRENEKVLLNPPPR